MVQIEDYSLENFYQILSWYSTIVFNRFYNDEDGLGGNSPFKPESWKVPIPSSSSDSDSGSGKTSVKYRTVANEGSTYAKSILKAFQTTGDNILFSLKTLFINNDDDKAMRTEDLNFNLISAYAAASQSFQKYNATTEEFMDMPEFWFTRGCWYDMLPMCTRGEYLLKYRGNVQNTVRNAISKCRRAYKKHSYMRVITESSSDGSSSSTRIEWEYYQESGNTYEFISDFWSSHLSSLKSVVDNALEPIWKIGRKTNYPMQNSSTADLEYVTQLMSDISSTKGSSISTAKQLSEKCGKYSAKKANVTLSK